jgi:hypothetical protein
VIATLMVSVVNVRAACLIVLVMVGFAGASAVQFHERHFYYLQFVPWFAFGLLAQAVMGGTAPLKRVPIRHAVRALLVGGAVCLAAGGTLLLSRAYQQRAAARLFDRYVTAPRTPLPIIERQAGDSRTLLATDAWLNATPPGTRGVETTFVAAQFRDDLCGPMTLGLTVRYQGRTADVDLSERLAVPLGSGRSTPTVVFIPAYDRADESVRFRGIEVTSSHSRCVGGLFRVEGLDRLPLLMTTVLAADWRDGSLFQRLR